MIFKIVLLLIFLFFIFICARNYDVRNRGKVTIDDALDICGITISAIVVGLCLGLIFG